MTLTDHQRIERRKHLGASDIPSLFGLDPFKTATDVWLTKIADVAEPEQQSDSIDMGNSFEKPLLEWAAKELNVEISINPYDLFAVCPQHPIFSATLDSLILNGGVPSRKAIEAKVTSRSEEWGEPGSDQVPDRVNVQVQSQMLAHGLQRVHVVVLLGRNGLKRELYRVDRNETIIAAIIEKCESFWNTYVIPKTTPPESEFGLGSIDIIKRVVRVPATWAEVDEALIFDWDAKRKAGTEAEKAEELALERMLTPLKDAEGVHLSDGRTLEYLPTTKSILDQKKFKAEQPELYEAFLKSSISRTPRLKGTINE